MGVVYEARHSSLDRRVALKVLPAGRANRHYQLRFEREARAAAGLHHTNIVPVFDFGVDDGQHYYVMQFIEGVGLDTVIRAMVPLLEQDKCPSSDVDEAGNKDETDGLPEAKVTQSGSDKLASSISGSPQEYYLRVANLIAQVADALSYAHSNGVIHRDIKPSNLLMDRVNHLWITDFGLAKVSDQDQDLTGTGDLIGTLRYMAPEALKGQFDERSDVYSLGLTLYEMLALRPAYDGADHAIILRQIADGSTPSVRSGTSRIPRDLATIVHKAIEHEPRNRYQTAALFASDLRRFVNGEPVTARPLSAPIRTWRWCRRHPVVATLITMLLMSLITGTAVSTYFAMDANNRATEANSERGRANKNAAAAAEKSDLAERRLYALTLMQAGKTSDTLLKQTRRVLEDEKLCPHHLREFRLAVVVSAGPPRQSTAASIGGLWDPKIAFSPDDTLHVASTDLPGLDRYDQVSGGLPGNDSDKSFNRQVNALFVLEQRSLFWQRRDGDRPGRPIKETRGGKPWRHSRTPQRLVGTVRCWAVAGKQSARATRGVTIWSVEYGSKLTFIRGEVSSLTFSPDGASWWERSTQWTAPPGVRVWHSRTGELLQSISLPLSVKDDAPQVVISDDGRLMLLAAGNMMSIWNTKDWLKVRSIEAGRVVWCQFSPDETAIACVTENSNDEVDFTLFEMGRGSVLLSIPLSTRRVASVAWSEADELLAVGSLDGVVELWNLENSAVLTIGAHETPVDALTFSGDGHHLASIDRSLSTQIMIWKLPNGEVGGKLVDEAAVTQLCFVPDSNNLVSTNQEGELLVWDVARKQVTRRKKIDRVNVTALDVSRDDGLVAVAAGSRVDLYEFATGNSLRNLRGHRGLVRTVAFSPDGRNLATGGDDGILRIWDTANGQVSHEFRGHHGSIRAAHYSSDGTKLVTGG